MQLAVRKLDIAKPQRLSPGVRKDVVMKRRASPFPKKQAQCGVFACNSVADFRSVDLGDLDVDNADTAENLGIPASHGLTRHTQGQPALMTILVARGPT